MSKTLISALRFSVRTLWRFEATANAEAFTSGALSYGAESNAQQAQRFPRDGSQALRL